jgi:hypothetical protein
VLQEVGGETADVMGELLAARADILTINITYNSLNTENNRVCCIILHSIGTLICIYHDHDAGSPKDEPKLALPGDRALISGGCGRIGSF